MTCGPAFAAEGMWTPDNLPDAQLRAKYKFSPDEHPLWGIEHGCRTVVIYSPADLSCFWNQSEIQRQA